MKKTERKNVTVSDWKKDKQHISFFETEQSKQMTRLFWKRKETENEMERLGFNR